MVDDRCEVGAVISMSEVVDSADEAYDMGKRDGYEEAVQDIDIATGGDGEFKGSTLDGETVDVPAMKARIISRCVQPAKEVGAVSDEMVERAFRYLKTVVIDNDTNIRRFARRTLEASHIPVVADPFDTSGREPRQKQERIAPGAYRVFWKSGGWSWATIGMTSNGDNWIAPANWLRPAMIRDLTQWGDVERIEPIATPSSPDVELQTAHPEWPDPLLSPQAEAIRNGKIDDTELRNLYDTMERELLQHRPQVAELHAEVERLRKELDEQFEATQHWKKLSIADAIRANMAEARALSAEKALEAIEAGRSSLTGGQDDE